MDDVRPLGPGDLPALEKLVAAAGWNQTPDDWRRVMRIQSDGCFGIEADGRVVSTATNVVFDTDLAWIGMVLTHPEYRGHGFARRLMDQSLDFLRRSGVRWVKLDATDMGRPIYARLGFVDECPIERWRRPAGAPSAPARVDSFDLAVFAAMDRAAFGADRSRLLRDLAAQDAAGVSSTGYAMYRPGRVAGYLGPCVASDTPAARRLLRHFLNRYGDRDTFLDLLPGNKAAHDLAAEHGFQPVRRLVRMSLRLGTRAREVSVRDDYVFAIAGFEFG
jgi:GNAT superfamily N-acetyltransferase